MPAAVSAEYKKITKTKKFGVIRRESKLRT